MMRRRLLLNQKDLKFNQLMKINFTNVSDWDIYSGVGTFDTENNSVSIVGAIGRNGIKIRNSLNYIDIISGHKYYIKLKYKTNAYLQMYVATHTNYLNVTENLTDYREIKIGENRRNVDTFPNASGQSGDFTLKDLMVIDLTAMYGEGNEPTDIATIEQDCADIGHSLTQWQPYTPI